MRLKNPEDYKLLRFEKSKTKFKKYDAILQNVKTKRLRKIPFGDIRYQHYKDSTPLKLYKHLNHGDKIRRKSYRSRHNKTKDYKFSSSYFAYYYLW